MTYIKATIKRYFGDAFQHPLNCELCNDLLGYSDEERQVSLKCPDCNGEPEQEDYDIL